MIKPSLILPIVSLYSLLTPIVALAGGADQLTTAPVSRPSNNSNLQAIPPLELQQYVQAVKQIQAIEKESQQKMGKIIQDSGMAVERFIEVDKSLTTGSTPANGGPVTDRERQQHAEITAKMQKVWRESQPKKERAVSSQGLSIERFAQINRQVQQDSALQQKVKLMLGS